MVDSCWGVPEDRSSPEIQIESSTDLSLRSKIANPAEPVVLYEVIPPRVDVEGELADRLALVREVANQVDAINIPEIREEKRNGPREKPMPERIAPRDFAQAIACAIPVETVVNRVTVHESPEEQRRWLCETHRQCGIRDLILVGGESQQHDYTGPSVVQTASMAAEEGLPFLLGGITIPHRPQEASRVRQKVQHGLQFFTTQVLLDSKETIKLLKELDELQVRVLLSFTPVSHPRDLKFLEWLGVEIPSRFARSISTASNPEAAVKQSLALARGILKEVFNSLSPKAPALGIQVERITKRNSAAARWMLSELGEYYRGLMQLRYSAARVGVAPSSARRSAPRSIPSKR
jgi:5,10-methylenetetrahydrofolate reductase